MKNIAFARREKKDLYLYLYKDNIPAEPSSISAMMMNRIDFDIKILEIPPVSDDEVRNLLQYRLRSVYPGDPEDTRFDFKLINRNKKRYAVLFITSRKNMERYRELSANKPLLLPYSIVQNHLKTQKGEKFIYLFWDHDWVDILIFNAGVLESSSALKREKEISLDIIKIKNILPNALQEYKFFIAQLESERELLHNVFNDFQNKEFLSIESLLAHKISKRGSLFVKSIGIDKLTNKIRLDVLLLPVIFLICLIFNSYVDNRVEYKKLLEKTHTDKLAKSQSQTKYQALKKELDSLKKIKPLDTYLLFSELTKEMGGDAILNKVKIKVDDRSFYLEGEAMKAEVYSKSLNANKIFKNVQITEILPDPNIKKDRFKLIGVVNANQ